MKMFTVTSVNHPGKPGDCLLIRRLCYWVFMSVRVCFSMTESHKYLILTSIVIGWWRMIKWQKLTKLKLALHCGLFFFFTMCTAPLSITFLPTTWIWLNWAYDSSRPKVKSQKSKYDEFQSDSSAGWHLTCKAAGFARSCDRIILLNPSHFYLQLCACGRTTNQLPPTVGLIGWRKLMIDRGVDGSSNNLPSICPFPLKNTLYRHLNSQQNKRLEAMLKVITVSEVASYILCTSCNVWENSNDTLHGNVTVHQTCSWPSQ